jgi:3-oxoadipate enol-lactonase
MGGMSASRPPVVFVHSFPLDARMWSAQVEGLALHGYACITPDLPGFGAAPLPSSDLTPSLDVYANAVARALEGHPPAVVVGLSLGGYVAFRLLARHPRRVRAVVLADTRAAGDAPEVKAGRILNSSLVNRHGAGALIDKMLPMLVAPTSPQAARDRVREIGAAQRPAAISFALLAMRDRADATPMLETLDRPTMFVVGEHDAITPPAEHRAMAARVKDASLVEIPGAGHMSNLEAPERFNQALLRFLSALR